MAGNKRDDHRHSQSADVMLAISNTLQELGTRAPSGVQGHCLLEKDNLNVFHKRL